MTRTAEPEAIGTGAVSGQDGHGKRERAAERADHPHPGRITSADHGPYSVGSVATASPQTTTTTAIAWQSACDSDNDELSQPCSRACSATDPLNRSRGSEPSRVTSISRNGKGMSGSGESLDHCFLGREPGRQSMRAVGTAAVIDFTRRENLAQVSVTERLQRVLNFLDGKDIATGADAVPVDFVRPR